MTALHDNPDCFCCGTENPTSFRLQVAPAGDQIVGTAIVDRRHEGARGVMHGGALAAVIDEVLGSVSAHLGRPGVTGTLTVYFRAPVVLPATISLRGWCERSEARKLYLRAEAHDGSTLVAEASGIWIQPSERPVTT